jgi:RND family efflux transporter MFP subunit
LQHYLYKIEKNAPPLNIYSLFLDPCADCSIVASVENICLNISGYDSKPYAIGAAMNQQSNKPSTKARAITWGVPLILLAVISAIMVSAQNEVPQETPQAEHKLPNVEVQTVRTTPFDDELILPARIEAARSALIAAEFGGKVEQWLVKEGAKVTVGDPVLRLDTKTIRASLAEVSASKVSAQAALTAAKSSAARTDASLTKAKRDAQSVDLDLASAESARELAEADYSRAEKLVKEGVATKASLDRARDGVNQARLGVDRARDSRERAALAVEVASAGANEALAAIDIAKARIAEVEAAENSLKVRLAKHTITAPFGGSIEKHLAETGEVVSTGQPLTLILDFSTVKALVSIPDRYVPFFDVDNPALAEYLSLQQTGAISKLSGALVIPGLPKLTGDKAEGLEIPATITRVARASDPTSNTFEVELTTENPGEALRQGMIANGHITFLHYKDAVVIPISSIQVTDEGPRVLVVEGSNGVKNVSARDVEPLSISGNSVHIGSGLAEGDKLVVRGWKGVVPGEKVNVVMEDGTLASRNGEKR